MRILPGFSACNPATLQGPFGVRNPGMDCFDPTTCCVSNDDPFGGGGGGPTAALPRSKGFAPTLLSATPHPSSTIISDLIGQFPNATTQITAFQRATAPTNTTPTMASGHIIAAGNGNERVNLWELSNVDFMVCPQWHANQNNGGGARGGIAQGGYVRVAALDEAGSQTAAAALKTGLDPYEQERDNQPGKFFEHGTVIMAKTGATKADKELVPQYIAHIASVPPAHLRWQRNAASQQTRMLYVSSIVRNLLKNIRDAVATDPTLSTRSDKPIRVALPMLCTGPDGAVTLEECATILFTEIGNFCKDNPGFEFVVPIYSSYQGDWNRAEQLDRFVKIIGGDPDALKDAEAIRPRTPRQVFEETIDIFKNPVPNGIPFDSTYCKKKFSQWRDTFCRTIDQGPVDTPKAIQDRFGTNAEAQLAECLYRLSSLKNGQVTENGFVTPEITAQALKALFDDPKTANRIFTIIHGSLSEDARDNFGGDEKMNDLMASALAQVVEDEANRLYKQHWQVLEKKMRDQAQLIASLEAERQKAISEKQVAEQHAQEERDKVEELESQVTSTQTRLDRLKKSVAEDGATHQREVETLESAINTTRTQLSEARQKVVAANAKISALEDKVSDLTSRASTASSSFQGTSNSSSSFSGSYGRSG